jgi:hypothetical protein
MENTVKNIELIDKFVENERKSKMWTVASVFIFCLLGGLVFLLAYKLNKSNAKYKEQNVELLETQKKLDSALDELAGKNQSLRADSLSLSGQVVMSGNRADSLKKIYDTVSLLFNTQFYSNDGPESDPKARLDELGKKTFSDGNVVLSDNLKKIIQDRSLWQINERPVYTISIKSMPENQKIAEQMAEIFKEKKYDISPVEIIQKFSFNPLIKYFNDDDLEMAQKIASQINNSNNEFFKKNPVTIQKINVKTTLHQIEIWIGQYKKIDYKQLTLKYEKYNKIIEK